MACRLRPTNQSTRDGKRLADEADRAIRQLCGKIEDLERQLSTFEREVDGSTPGGVLPPGTVDDSTLRWDAASLEWQENVLLLADEGGDVTLESASPLLTVGDSLGSPRVRALKAAAGASAYQWLRSTSIDIGDWQAEHGADERWRLGRRASGGEGNPDVWRPYVEGREDATPGDDAVLTIGAQTFGGAVTVHSAAGPTHLYIHKLAGAAGRLAFRSSGIDHWDIEHRSLALGLGLEVVRRDTTTGAELGRPLIFEPSGDVTIGESGSDVEIMGTLTLDGETMAPIVAGAGNSRVPRWDTANGRWESSTVEISTAGNVTPVAGTPDVGATLARWGTVFATTANFSGNATFLGASHAFGDGAGSPAFRLRKGDAGISELQMLVGTSVADHTKSIAHLTDERLTIRTRLSSAWIDAILIENTGDVTIPNDLTLPGTGSGGDGSLTMAGTLSGAQAVVLDEQSSAPSVAAGEGAFWVEDTVPSRPMFTDDAGGDHVLATVEQIEHSESIANADWFQGNVTFTTIADAGVMVDLVDGALARRVAARFRLPEWYVDQGLTVKIRLRSVTSVDGNFRIDARAGAENSDATLLGTITDVAATVSPTGTTAQYESIPLTHAEMGSPAAGSHMYLRIRRLANDAADTATTTMRIISASITVQA